MDAGALTSRGPRLLIGIPLGLLAGLVALVISLALLFSGGAQGCAASTKAGLTGEVDGVSVPPRLIPIYQEASKRYRLGPRGPSVLASVNWNESSFGANMGQAPGAMGWMSFLPESWDAYGVDGDRDGDRDPFDPWDGIFAAGNLLSAAGAPDDWHSALFSYNHSESYVANVLAEAKEFNGAAADTEVSICAGAGAPNETVAAMLAEAERLSRLRPQSEYVYGGSHVTPTPANGPFDCSSAVSHLLQVAGFENPTMDTVAFSSWGKSGPGRWVTLHNKPYGGDAHIFIEFSPELTPPAKRYWGTSGFVAKGHGPGWIPESTFDSNYLAGFELRHPPGL